MSKDNNQNQRSSNSGGQNHGYGGPEERYEYQRGTQQHHNQQPRFNQNQPNYQTPEYRGGQNYRNYPNQQPYEYDSPQHGGFYPTNVPYHPAYGGYHPPNYQSQQITTKEQKSNEVILGGESPTPAVHASVPVPEILGAGKLSISEDEKEEFIKSDDKKFEIINKKLIAMEEREKVLLKYIRSLESDISNRFYQYKVESGSRISAMENEMGVLRNLTPSREELNRTGQLVDVLQRKSSDLVGRVQQINNRVNTLSFNQNSRIARSLKFRYECIVREMIQKEYGVEIDFRPLEVRNESTYFREPRQCSDNLTKQFKDMRDFMNQVSSHRSPLDNRKDKFLRIPGDKIAFPSVSIDDDGRVVIFRMTTSPLACLFDKNYTNLRHMYTFVKNLFYNMSVLEYQVSSIKDPTKMVLVVFVYESLQYSSSSLCDFVRYYPLEFKNLNDLFNNDRMVALSMKDLDTKRISLKDEIKRNDKASREQNPDIPQKKTPDVMTTQKVSPDVEKKE